MIGKEVCDPRGPRVPAARQSHVGMEFSALRRHPCALTGGFDPSLQMLERGVAFNASPQAADPASGFEMADIS